jgi:hypothetical protein
LKVIFSRLWGSFSKPGTMQAIFARWNFAKTRNPRCRYSSTRREPLRDHAKNIVGRARPTPHGVPFLPLPLHGQNGP